MARPAGGGGPTIEKGSFIVLAGTQVTKKHSFMFNPNDVDDTKATSYGMTEVPGLSHPIYQFGSGGERLLSFSLYLDGDRGRMAGGGSQPDPRNPEGGKLGVRIANDPGLDISNEILFYRSLVYPTQYLASFANVFPPLVIFSLGTLYQNIRCIVKRADPKVTYWAPLPNTGENAVSSTGFAAVANRIVPVRATVAIQLAEVPTKSVLSSDVLTSSGFLD